MSRVSEIYDAKLAQEKLSGAIYAVIIPKIADDTTIEDDIAQLGLALTSLGYTQADVDSDVAAVEKVMAVQAHIDNVVPVQQARWNAVKAEQIAAEAALKAAQERYNAAMIDWRASSPPGNGHEQQLIEARAKARRVYDSDAYLTERDAKRRQASSQ